MHINMQLLNQWQEKIIRSSAVPGQQSRVKREALLRPLIGGQEGGVMSKHMSYADYLLQAEQRSIAQTGRLPYLPSGIRVVIDSGGSKPRVLGVEGLFKPPNVDGNIKEVDKHYRRMVAQEKLQMAKKATTNE